MNTNSLFLGDYLLKLSNPINKILDLFQGQNDWTLPEIVIVLPEFQIKNIQYWLNQLHKKGVIVKIPNLLDMRRVQYRIATQQEFEARSAHLQLDEIIFCQSILDLFMNSNYKYNTR